LDCRLGTDETLQRSEATAKNITSCDNAFVTNILVAPTPLGKRPVGMKNQPHGYGDELSIFLPETFGCRTGNLKLS